MSQIVGFTIAIWVNAINLLVWGRYEADLSKIPGDFEEEIVNLTFF